MAGGQRSLLRVEVEPRPWFTMHNNHFPNLFPCCPRRCIAHRSVASNLASVSLQETCPVYPAVSLTQPPVPVNFSSCLCPFFVSNCVRISPPFLALSAGAVSLSTCWYRTPCCYVFTPKHTLYFLFSCAFRFLISLFIFLLSPNRTVHHIQTGSTKRSPTQVFCSSLFSLLCNPFLPFFHSLLPSFLLFSLPLFFSSLFLPFPHTALFDDTGCFFYSLRSPASRQAESPPVPNDDNKTKRQSLQHNLSLRAIRIERQE